MTDEEVAQLVGSLNHLCRALAAPRTEIVPITPAVCQRAAKLIDRLALLHGLRLADTLIGAAAMESTLMTANVKHFGAIEGPDIETFRP